LDEVIGRADDRPADFGEASEAQFSAATGR